MKAYIEKTKEEINKNKENVQDKYDEKLKKMKDVCAQLFFKYEGELDKLEKNIADIDKRCDDWADLVVKPQELN